MKIKFTKHPYPESLDADDAPPQLVSFSVSESECEYVYIFYTLVNAAGGQPPTEPPLRGPPAGQKGFTGNPRTTSLHILTFFTPFTHLSIEVWGWGFGLGFGVGVWVWGWVLGFGCPVPPRTTPRCRGPGVCFIFNEWIVYPINQTTTS